MGKIKELYDKTKWGKEDKEKKERQQLEDEVRAELKEEIKAEAKAKLREKIKQEEINKVVNPESKPKSNFLGKLGEEFKGSNLGSNDQMNKMLGKQPQNQNTQQNGGGLSNDAILRGFGSTSSGKNQDVSGLMGNKSLNTNKDIPGMLGSGHNFGRDNNSMFGIRGEKKTGEQIVGLTPDPKKKINQLLGKKE